MKGITTKVLSVFIILMMVTTSVFASMSVEELEDVFNGKQSGTQTHPGILSEAYKYVSADQYGQMGKIRADLADDDNLDPVTKGIAQLMIFTTTNTSANDVTAQINKAATDFYPAYQILDHMAGNKLTKDALGKLLIDLTKNLRSNLTAGGASNINDLYLKTGTAYTDGIRDLMASTIASTLEQGTYELADLREEMLTNGNLTKTGADIDPNSPFIKVVVDAIDLLNTVEDGSDTASVVANTIMVGVLDLQISASLGGAAPVTVAPNNKLPDLTVGQKIEFEVLSGVDGLPFNNFTSWLDYGKASYPGISLSKSTDGKYVITATSAGSGILKLYRNVTLGEGNDAATDKIMIELSYNVNASATPTPTPSSQPSGPSYGGGSRDIIITQPTSVPTSTGIPDGFVPVISTDHVAYVHGYEDSNFRSGNPVTRAEVAAMFSRIVVNSLNVSSDYEAIYNDVYSGSWYSPYVMYCSKMGLLKGYEDGSFRPDDYITRGEFATIASRFTNLTSGDASRFSDVGNHWAASAIGISADRNWVVGYEDGTFRPDASITRAETVTIVNRIAERFADKNYIDNNLDKLITYPDVSSEFWAYYDIMEASNNHNHSKETGVEIWEN